MKKEIRNDVRQRISGYIGRSQWTRAAWRWWDHQRTDVYLLSYPKCGRTWLRLMIGKALVEEHHRIGHNPMDLSGLHRDLSRVPRIRISHDDDPQKKRPEQVDNDKSRYASKTVLFLVRDPRDVVVSYYFQASKRRDRFSGDIAEFLRHPVGALDTILRFYNVWAQARTVPRNFCLVRYEDLHQDPARELTKVLEIMGCPVSAKSVEAAVDFSRFDNMRKLERNNAFGSNRLKPADKGDDDSFKTRKGQVKGYRDYFDDDDIAYMDERIRSTLSPFYSDYLHGE